MIWVVAGLLIVLILLVLALFWWVGEVAKDLSNMIVQVSRQVAGLGQSSIDDLEAVKAVQRRVDELASFLIPRRRD